MVNISNKTSKKNSLKAGKKFKLNRWLVFDGIVLIIIVGVLAVRFTRASVDSTFMRTPQQMNSGTIQRSVVGGEARHIVTNEVHAETSVTVDATEMQASRQVCADMRANSPQNFVDIQINGHFANKFADKPGEVTVCADVNNDNRGGEIYVGTNGDASVYRIYGVR